jgi:hypothetical protein
MSLYLKIFKIYLKTLPLILVRSFYILINMLITILFLVSFLNYHEVVWNMNFDDIITKYAITVLPYNIAVIILVNIIFLNRLNYAIPAFSSEFLVSGKSPAYIRQISKSKKILINIFKSITNMKKEYLSFKLAVFKKKPSLFLLNLKNIYIAYCTARNDSDSSSSIRFLELYLFTYSIDFLKNKFSMTLFKICFLSAFLILFFIILPYIIPDIIILPNKIIVYKVISVILGYGFYKIIFSPFFMQLELAKTLIYLKDKRLPLGLR